jgi:hypothetical protein
MRASDLIDTPFIDVQTIGDIISPIQYVPFLERRLDLSSLQSVGDVHFETDDHDGYVTFSYGMLSDSPKGNMITHWYEVTAEFAKQEGIDILKACGRNIRFRNVGEYGHAETIWYYLVDFYEAWLHNHIMNLCSVWVGYKIQTSPYWRATHV